MPQISITLRVSAREFHTVLAALRYYQAQGQGEPGNRSQEIEDLASNLGQVQPLTKEEIDRLCERMNA